MCFELMADNERVKGCYRPRSAADRRSRFLTVIRTSLPVGRGRRCAPMWTVCGRGELRGLCMRPWRGFRPNVGSGGGRADSSSTPRWQLTGRTPASFVTRPRDAGTTCPPTLPCPAWKQPFTTRCQSPRSFRATLCCVRSRAMVFISPVDRASDAWYSGDFHRARIPCQRQCQEQNAMVRCGKLLISSRRSHVLQRFTVACFFTTVQVSPYVTCGATRLPLR